MFNMHYLLSGRWTKPLFMVVFTIIPMKGTLADNCSAFNIYEKSNGWPFYGDVFNG